MLGNCKQKYFYLQSDRLSAIICLMDSKLAPYLTILRSSGFKLTPKRKSVIGLFLKEKRTLAPQEVHEKIKRVISPLGLPTIYRILEELSSIGVLVSVVSDERLLSYALCSKPQDHHHHFICRSCKRIEEVDYCGIEGAERAIQKKLGCRIDSHLFQVEGVCKTCLSK